MCLCEHELLDLKNGLVTLEGVQPSKNLVILGALA